MLTLEYNEDIAKEVERQEILEEGLKQGLEEGLEQGKEQRNIEIAKNLLDILDVETISIKTGVPLNTVLMLKNNK